MLWIRPLGKYFRLSINRCRHDEDGLLLKIFSETVRASANFNSFSESLQPLQYDPSPGNSSQPSSLASHKCPSYVLSELNKTADGFDASLMLNGKPCHNDDIASLKLIVNCKIGCFTDERLHVRIVDATAQRYEVPALLFPRPTVSKSSKTALIATRLSPNANIYGLGESTDTFRINLDGNGTRRTMWARDAYGTQKGTNLYGTHPVYYDHRISGTHGVFLLNSNGMDITLRKELIQYDIIGGVLDFYFLAGPSPVKVAEQYAALAGLPAMIPYWSLGFQQCRYGYSNYIEVAEVIANYSKAGIPLETMWTDIDYMYKRRTFTLDPDYFPLERMQEIVKSLHQNDQRYVMMIDPAIAYQPGDKGVFDRGTEADVFLKEKDGKVFQGVVWAGVSVYPDWFHPNAEAFWTHEIQKFFDPTDGIDIDGIWIDMNEPANFALPCAYPCKDASLLPGAQAIASGNPPARKNLPPRKDLSKGTVRPDLVHHNGLTEYDVHNLYGTHMSWITRKAMLSRRSKVRPQVVTRSTFAGAGAHGKDRSLDRRQSIRLAPLPVFHHRIMSFAALFQMPLVGADVCGFGSNTNEELCARWAALGAFYPFFRNHNELGFISQEFYRWESVARSARNAIKIRYSLLDYFYTHVRRQTLTGEPALKPLWFSSPKDPATFAIDKQFFFGDSILISPVTEANSTTVKVYFPEPKSFSGRAVVGHSGMTELQNVQIDQIPVHIKPGSILPIRQVTTNMTSQLAMTTTEVRKRSFEILVIPGSSGSAKGSLYLDDGESLEPLLEESAELEFNYEKRVLLISGRLGSSIKDINTSVSQWTFTDVPNIEKVKGLRIVDSPQLESGAQLLPVRIDAKTRTACAQGNWKLKPGMQIALIY
ncbi:hypothetical protein KEM48_006463 [Puccinia striiformis f. sp. tritici PST-130]|nr:hypothetical protein KEM48_006463 [Puccinia striiformis f. sp. tritici PST-130]